jgi:hypothetical protein
VIICEIIVHVLVIVQNKKTLKPETSSDSPSAKSKGVRLVSDKQEINQINDKGREIKIIHK